MQPSEAPRPKPLIDGALPPNLKPSLARARQDTDTLRASLHALTAVFVFETRSLHVTSAGLTFLRARFTSDDLLRARVVDQRLRFLDREDLDDVRVRQRGGGLRLALEAGHHAFLRLPGFVRRAQRGTADDQRSADREQTEMDALHRADPPLVLLVYRALIRAQAP